MLDALAAEELDELEAQTRHSMSSSKLSDVSIVGADVILRLIAQARAARPSPWQPIETAPKDGTLVLAARTTGYLKRPFCCSWSDNANGQFNWNDTEYTFSPEVWMPIPTLPFPPAQDGGHT